MGELITPMKRIIARDLIYNLLLKRLKEQKEIAAQKGYTDAEISSFIDFNIFNNTNRIPDISFMPCAVIYWDKTEFQNGDIYENDGINTLIVDIYASGYADDKETAENYASNRYDYLESQIYNMLCAETAKIYTETKHLVIGFTLLDLDNVYQNEVESSAGAVYMGRFRFNVEIDEPTEYLETRTIKEIYVNSEVQNAIIETFVQISERQQT